MGKQFVRGRNRTPNFQWVEEELDWHEEAACFEMGIKLFFSQKKSEIATAKGICRRCPVRKECYQYAKRTKQAFGVWGGVEFRQGKKY